MAIKNRYSQFNIKKMLDKKKVVLFFMLIPIFGAFVHAGDISSCTTLDTGGTTYTLTEDLLDVNNTCITIGKTPYTSNDADNIVLDCQGHTISDENDTLTLIIILDWSDDITIQNCIFEGTNVTAISSWDNSNFLFTNSTYNVMYPFRITYADRVNITNSNITSYGNSSFTEVDDLYILNSTIGTHSGTALTFMDFGDGNTNIFVYNSNMTSFKDDLTTGLVGWWDFDVNSATQSNGISGGIDNGLVSGATFTSSGKFNGAYSFDGVDDYITMGNSSSTVLDNINFTISAWVYVTANNSDMEIVSKEGDGSHSAIELRYDIDDGYWEFNVNDGAWKYAKYSQAPIELNTWVHVVGVRNGTNIRIYVNGVKGAYADTIGTIEDSAEMNLTVGYGGPVAERYFSGVIDEVRVYNRDLSESEILELYHSSLPLFISASSKNLNSFIYNNIFNVGAFDFLGNAIQNKSVSFNTTKQAGNVLLWNGTQIGGNYYINSTVGFSEICADTNYDGFCDSSFEGSEGATDFLAASNKYDNVKPEVTLDYPVIGFNSSSTEVNVNFTVIDGILDTCWWTNSSGEINYTLTGCSNLTGIGWTVEGWYNITIYANDTNGNENSTTSTFQVDTTSPSLTIYHPEDYQSFIVTIIDLNFSATDTGAGLDTCWYQNDTDSMNVSVTCGDNATIDRNGDGTFEAIVYANDTVGNEAKLIHYFTISSDSPAVSLNSPTNNQYLNYKDDIYFNFTAEDSDGLDTCELWGTWGDGWHKNYTWYLPESAVTNWTVVEGIGDGTYLYNVFCNDSSTYGNFSTSNFTFTPDTIYPDVAILTGNSSSVYGLSVDIRYNISDANIDEHKYNLMSSSGTFLYPANLSFAYSGYNVESVTVPTYGTWHLYIWGSDYSGNENSTSIQIIFNEPESGSGPGGLGSPTTPTEEEEEIELNVCGNGICEEGETCYNCEDCGKCNVDDLILTCFAGTFIGDFFDIPNTPEVKSKCIKNQAPVIFWISAIFSGGVVLFIFLKTKTGKKVQRVVYQTKKPEATYKRRKPWIKRWMS